MRSVCLALLLAPASLVGQDPRSAAVDALFERWNSSESPGAAVAVVRADELLHLGTYGVRDVETRQPITADSAFYIASSSKQFTAACVLHLAAEGGLSVDDEVRKHVPELPDYGEPITIRHLLNHRSGLRDFFELMVVAGWDIDRKMDEDEVLRLICRQQALNFPPGSDFGYSNTGYFLLAEIVRRVSGSSLREYADKNLFEPLGMTRSTFKDDPELVIDEMAVGHEPTSSGYRARHTDFALVGSGGLYTMLGDLVRWQKNFKRAEWGGNLLEQMQTPQVLRVDQGRSPELGRYGFGLILREYRGERVVMHPGGSYGYQANLLRFPDQDLSIVILANASSVPASDLGFEIADIYLGPVLAAEPVASTGSGMRPGARIFRKRDGGDVLILSTRGDGTSRIATLSYKFEVVATGASTLRSLGSGLPVVAELTEGGRLEVRIEDQRPDVYEELALSRPDQEDEQRKLGEYASAELDASVRLIDKRGQLAIDDSEMAMPIPPFMTIDPNTAISDRGVQLDFVRDEGGEVTGMYLSTGRARRIFLTRK